MIVKLSVAKVKGFRERVISVDYARGGRFNEALLKKNIRPPYITIYFYLPSTLAKSLLRDMMRA